MTKKSISKVEHKGLRLVLIVIGLGCTALAVVGIFLPVLPTVPFLLLAAACFARSSEAFHDWLLNHRQLGPMIRGYLDDLGIPLRAKIISISLLWGSIFISVFFLVSLTWIKIILLAIGLCVTVYLLRLPLCNRQ